MASGKLGAVHRLLFRLATDLQILDPHRYVIEPLFDRGFIFDSYAKRVGKGTHAAVARYEFFRYFPAIDHVILKADLRRRISCQRTLWLIDAIIDGSNEQEPVHIHYPGDDLFTPWQRRRGLPLGNLTSQFFANLYLDGLDHFCTEVLRPRGYLRYVDDFALFDDDPNVLEGYRRPRTAQGETCPAGAPRKRWSTPRTPCWSASGL